MAFSRAEKEKRVERMSRELADASSAIVGTFSKLTVAQDFELRKAVRAVGGRYHVVKNTLIVKAAHGTKVESVFEGLKGVSSVAYTNGDPVALAKALSKWVEANAEFTFKLGIIDGRPIQVEEIKQLASLPSREQMFAKLLMLMNAPAQRLATVIAATGRDLAVVLNQGVVKEKFQAAAGAEG